MRLRLRCTVGKCGAALALFPILALIALITPASQRVRLAPKFSPGESFRYRIESRTTTTGKTTSPIANPEGGSQSNQTIHLEFRLDVLDVPPAAAGSTATRLRATYEKSSAESASDAFDPAQPSIADQYSRVEGRSIEFTLGPGGKLADIKGLDELLPDRAAAQSMVSWLDGLFPATALPPDGITIGQKWKNERPLDGMPLTGLVWRTESTYLRDEPCDSSSSINARTAHAVGRPVGCAVILTRFEISHRGSPHSDATPEDYLRNGLRTSGTWTGSGESLDTISLASGLLVSSTQTSTQDMDYQITSASSGSSIHRTGQVQTQSEITLLPNQM
jgi:hypothetical protein